MIHLGSTRLVRSPYVASLAAAALVLVVSVWSVWYVYHYIPVMTGRAVILRNDGFHPHVLTVQPGERVTFINRSSSVFWPASNGHPQHDLYSEFDAGHAIPSGASFTFLFSREGKWGYHDHLHSYFTGVINVGTDAVTYDCTQHLSGLSSAEKRDCWNMALLEELEVHGAAAAFTKFAQFYASDPDFTKIGCHVMAHALGDAAYGEYLRKGRNMSVLQFPPESTYCGYGYYHGILEHMIRDNPDYKKADAFCKWLIREHGDTLPRIRLNCYHAIGHGFIPEPTDADMWGDVQALTKPAIEACMHIREKDARTECFQGSFNVIADWMWNNQFGFRFPEHDSLSVCRTFADAEVRRGCYYELSMRLVSFTDNNLEVLYNRYVRMIDEDDIAEMVINSAAASVVGAHIEDTNFLPYLYQCRALPERVRTGCIKGLSAAFVAHGEPEHEYEKAFAFCGDSELTAWEKRICYWNAMRMLMSAYTSEKVGPMCAHAPSEYRVFCTPGAQL